MAAVAHGESRVENCHRFLRISRCSRLPHGYMAGEMPLPFSMVCWNPCYFGRLCQENGTFAEILWMVEPFCLQRESRECKTPVQKLAFRECLIVRFRETYYLVVSCVCRVKNVRNSMAKPRSLLFGARRCWREFFCTARAQCGASWYYQPVRLIESYFTFLAFSRDRSIAFPCVS